MERALLPLGADTLAILPVVFIVVGVVEDDVEALSIRLWRCLQQQERATHPRARQTTGVLYYVGSYSSHTRKLHKVLVARCNRLRDERHSSSLVRARRASY